MPLTGWRWAAAFPWNALLCGRRFAVPEVTPVAVTAERVTGGNLGQAIQRPSGPRPTSRSGPRAPPPVPAQPGLRRGEPGMHGVNITDLDPDHHRAPGRVGRVPGDLEQPLTGEEHKPGINRPRSSGR